VIDVELERALRSAGVNPKLLKAAQLQLRKMVIAELDPKTQDLVVKATQAHGGSPVDALVRSWTEKNRAYLVPAVGTGACGFNANRPTKMRATPDNPFGLRFNMTKAAQLLQKDRKLANRLAQEAGFADALAALRPPRERAR
jgi:hypothetical protein